MDLENLTIAAATLTSLAATALVLLARERAPVKPSFDPSAAERVTHVRPMQS